MSPRGRGRSRGGGRGGGRGRRRPGILFCQLVALSLVLSISYKLAKVSLNRRRGIRTMGETTTTGGGNGRNGVQRLRSVYDRDYRSWTFDEAEAAMAALGDEVMEETRGAADAARTLGEAAQDALRSVETAAANALLGEEEEDDAIVRVARARARADTISRGDGEEAVPLPRANFAATQTANVPPAAVEGEEEEEEVDDDGWDANAAGPLPEDKVVATATTEQAKEEGAVSEVDDNHNPSNPDDVPLVECGVWLAETSSSRWTDWDEDEDGDNDNDVDIRPRAVGLYAGRDYVTDQEIFPGGDVVVPYFDLLKHQGSDRAQTFPWERYAWDSDKGIGTAMNREAEFVGSAGPGTGTLLRCIDGVPGRSGNVEGGETVNVGETAVGGGALEGGGDDSNETRPLHRNRDPGAGSQTPYVRSATATIDIAAGTELFALSSSSPNRCRTLDRTSPHKFRAHTHYIRELKTEERRHESTKAPSIRWLEKNGICADNVRMGKSKLPQAGRGAMANSRMKWGEVVMPVPLMHFPDRSVMDLYGDVITESLSDGSLRITKRNAGQQPLLNYCYGHPDTTALLCPYGHGPSLVNHDQKWANVELRWADPKKSAHRPEVLDRTIDEIRSMNSAHPVLAWEMVAKRTIEEGEEILLDYGEGWQRAWADHTSNWSPPKNGVRYHSAKEVNSGPSFLKLLKMKRVPKSLILMGRDWGEEAMFRCTIESWTESSADPNGETVMSFTAWFPEDGSLLTNADMEMFEFVDKPYTTDLHLKGAFRHEMGIPDGMLPKSWRNNVQGGEWVE